MVGCKMVQFGNMEAIASMTAERKMRVMGLRLKSDSDFKRAIRVLSACFDKKSNVVAKFMWKNMGTVDLQRLQVYLIGGQKLLTVHDKLLDGAIAGFAKKTLEDRLKEKVDK